MRFTKMQALGNDYVYIDAINQKLSHLPELAKFISDRHFAVGSDGMVLIYRSAHADFRMRMFNPDGTEGEMCGNALRSVGKYVYDHRLTDRTELMIETMAGIKKLWLTVTDGIVSSIRADIGEPEFNASKIPVRTRRKDFINQTVPVLGRDFQITAVSWGNPHAVVFVDDVTNFDVEKYGRAIENMTELFPKKTNVTFAQFDNGAVAKIREWERGTGETISCGTGCCSAVVAGVLNGYAVQGMAVEQRGGVMYVAWDSETNHVFLTGPSKTVFESKIDVSEIMGGNVGSH